MKILNTDCQIDCSFSSYPSQLISFTGRFQIPQDWVRGTVFGSSLGSGPYEFEHKTIQLFKNSFFTLPIFPGQQTPVFESDSRVCLILRHGFLGLPLLLGQAEATGRLSYVDGCSDTILAYPARSGDPSLNFLYIPSHVQQTSHLHPTLRLGFVVDGEGLAETISGEHALKKGDSFYIQEHEIHRFKTSNQSLSVVAFHPEGDFGPKDNDHMMINRSYFNDKISRK